MFLNKNINDGNTFSEIDLLMIICEYHHRQMSPSSNVIVRDFETLKPIKMGKNGLMNSINPVAHSYAGVSILQDDSVQITMEDGCWCVPTRAPHRNSWPRKRC